MSDSGTPSGQAPLNPLDVGERYSRHLARTQSMNAEKGIPPSTILWGRYKENDDDEEESERISITNIKEKCQDKWTSFKEGGTPRGKREAPRQKTMVQVREEAEERDGVWSASTPQEALEKEAASQAAKRQIPWYILDPDHAFRRRWDITQAILLFYVAGVVPFRVGMKYPAEGLSYWWELFIDFYFWMDVVFNFITGVQVTEGNKLHTDLPTIAKHYIISWFTIDIVASLPIDIVQRVEDGLFFCSLRIEGCEQSLEGPTSSILRCVKMLRLLKLLRLFRMKKLFVKYEKDLVPILPYLSVVRLLWLLLFLGHVFGCFFYLFSTGDWRTKEENEALSSCLHESPDDWAVAYGHVSGVNHAEYFGNRTGLTVNDCRPNWLVNEFGLKGYSDTTLEEVDVATRYIAALYWAFTTMTTVGYGDISATTRSERLFAILGMIAGGFVFSLIIGSMSTVLRSTNKRAAAMGERMESITSFLRDYRVPNRLSAEVYAFYRTQKLQLGEDERIVSELPMDLRGALLAHMFGNIIDNVTFFRDAEPIFVVEVCSRMTPVTFPSGRYVYQRGELGSLMYFIQKGKVEMLATDGESVATVLDDGNYFGEGAVLGWVKRNMAVRAVSWCDFASINTDDMSFLLDIYPHCRIEIFNTYVQRLRDFDQGKSHITDEDIAEMRHEKGIDRHGHRASGGRRSSGGHNTAAASGSGGGDATPPVSFRARGKAVTPPSDAFRGGRTSSGGRNQFARTPTSSQPSSPQHPASAGGVFGGGGSAQMQELALKVSTLQRDMSEVKALLSVVAAQLGRALSSGDNPTSGDSSGDLRAAGAGGGKGGGGGVNDDSNITGSGSFPSHYGVDAMGALGPPASRNYSVGKPEPSLEMMPGPPKGSEGSLEFTLNPNAAEGGMGGGGNGREGRSSGEGRTSVKVHPLAFDAAAGTLPCAVYEEGEEAGVVGVPPGLPRIVSGSDSEPVGEVAAAEGSNGVDQGDGVVTFKAPGSDEGEGQ